MSLSNEGRVVTESAAWTSSDGNDMIAVTAEKINHSRIIEMVSCPTSGATSVFIGTTRNSFEEKVVVSLEYEAYGDMALLEMKAICDKIRERWNVNKICIEHIIGSCPIGETSVMIAISSVHRKESLEAVDFAINELKRTVPIWKKVRKTAVQNELQNELTWRGVQELYSDSDATWKRNQEARRGDHDSNCSAPPLV